MDDGSGESSRELPVKLTRRVWKVVMSQQNTVAVLNHVLDRLTHTILQYLGESAPWLATQEAVRQKALLGLIEKQQVAASRVAELLAERHGLVQLTNYPFDLSATHYCSFDFMRSHLVKDEETLVAELKSAASQLSHDAEAGRVLEQLADDESQTLVRIKDL